MSSSQAQPQTAQRGDPAGVLYLLADAHAKTMTPILMRTGFGPDAFGKSGLLAFAMLFLAVCAAPEMGVWLCLWVIFVCRRRRETARLQKEGCQLHSHFAGRPTLALKFVRSEKTARVLIEPMLCLFVGIALLPLSQAAGGFLMLGFPSLLIRHGLEQEVDRKRLQRMQDAAMEQRWMSDRLRNRASEW